MTGSEEKIGKMRALRVVMGCALVLAVAVPSAFAETPQEAERRAYKLQVEPICKANSEENEDILKGVRAKVKAGKLGPAGSQFIKAAGALQRTLGKLEAVPQPPAYETKLAQWFEQVGDEAILLKEIGQALKQGKRPRASALSIQLQTGARSANATVVSFSFHYCRFETSAVS